LGELRGKKTKKRQRINREKTKRRRRKGLKSIKTRKWGLLLVNWDKLEP